MATVIQNGVLGGTDTDPDVLIGHMQPRLADPADARRPLDRRSAVLHPPLGDDRGPALRSVTWEPARPTGAGAGA